MQHKNRYNNPFAAFERTTRNLRWAAIGFILFTFPTNVDQTSRVYILLLAAALYNALRYLPGFHRIKFLSSPGVMLILDNLFVGLLIAQIGDISTPYSALLVLMVISAAYLYQLVGVVCVALMQAAILYVVSSNTYVNPVVLSESRLVVITVLALMLLGYLVASLTRDDREERKALVALRHKSEREKLRLHALVDSLNVAIFVTDEDGEIVDHNEAARTLSGADEGLIGEKLSRVLALHPRTGDTDKKINIIKDDATAQHRRDLCLHRSKDKVIDLDISVTPVESAEGKVAEYIVVCEDITTERSLDDQRAHFISVASHELRTPIAIIEAALGTISSSKSGIPESTMKLVEQAHRNSTLLAGIVRDITTLAEAQNDNLPIQLTHINAKEMLHNLKKDFQAQAEERGLEIRVVVDEKTPSVLSTRRYIEEILENYLTNALKYTENGAVTIKADPGNNGGALYSVHDEGIGISAKDQKMLFTKFFRAEDYRTRSTNGTGLGLYLCMEIAQRMNAKVWCDSTLNKGSIFYLEVPPFSNLKRDQGEVVEAQLSGIVDEL